MIGRDRLGCVANRDRGTCSNDLRIDREALEGMILGALRGHLMDDELCAEFCRAYVERVNELRIEHNCQCRVKNPQKCRSKIPQFRGSGQLAGEDVFGWAPAPTGWIVMGRVCRADFGAQMLGHELGMLAQAVA